MLHFVRNDGTSVIISSPPSLRGHVVAVAIQESFILKVPEHNLNSYTKKEAGYMYFPQPPIVP
ncbi:MAG: hypothetical protein WCG04_02235 [Alphaproteobacteria bacterium]